MGAYRGNTVLQCPICKSTDQKDFRLDTEVEVKGDGQITFCIFACKCSTLITNYDKSPRDFELALSWDGKGDYKNKIS